MAKLITLVSMLIAVAYSSIQAHAQTSSEQVVRNRDAQYPIIRDVVEEHIKQNWKTTSTNNFPGDELNTYECDSPSLQITGYMDKTDRLSPVVDVAFRGIVWRRFLIQAGYPAELVDPIFDHYEKSAYGGDKNDKSLNFLNSTLKRELNSFRKGKRGLPMIVHEGGCGAGGVSARVRADPADAQVFIIVEFNFRLCQAQGLDPYDRKRCDWWEEAHGDISSDYSGIYRYAARWSDGTERRGSFQLTDNSEKTTVVRISKPK